MNFFYVWSTIYQSFYSAPLLHGNKCVGSQQVSLYSGERDTCQTMFLCANYHGKEEKKRKCKKNAKQYTHKKQHLFSSGSVTACSTPFHVVWCCVVDCNVVNWSIEKLHNFPNIIKLMLSECVYHPVIATN